MPVPPNRKPGIRREVPPEASQFLRDLLRHENGKDCVNQQHGLGSHIQVDPKSGIMFKCVCRSESNLDSDNVTLSEDMFEVFEKYHRGGGEGVVIDTDTGRGIFWAQLRQVLIADGRRYHLQNHEFYYLANTLNGVWRKLPKQVLPTEG